MFMPQPDMDVSPIAFDLETAPLENVRDYLEPPDVSDIKAPSNYVKPEAIAGYIEKETAKQLADFETDCTNKAALDFNGARIVAIAWWTERGGMVLRFGKDEHSEATAIMEFWREAKQRTLVGFRIREFDIPMLIQRSRYLGIAHPSPDLGRYARGSGIVDLYDLLTFQDMRVDWVVRRTAKSFAKRFGIPVTDTIDGKDIPALVAAGEWDKVAAHCTADVELEVSLARKLGVITQPKPEVVMLGRDW